EVYWLEAYSTAGGRYSQIPTAMWIKRPKGQLAKCAKAASLRTAFPEDCGYLAEEMEGKSMDDLTDATVINGQATRVDTASDLTESVQVIDLSLIDAKVQKAVAEMVRRTTLAGAWQAAYDYANNKFSGLDLTFAITELDKASAAHQSESSSFEQSIEGVDMPPVTPIKEALNQARETLGSLRN
ncbi:MAG: recombinase RecT, partial [Methylococcaceae bacterium]